MHAGPAPAHLAARLSAFYAPSHVHLLSSAHHGIQLALMRFQQHMPDRKEVIVPAYICSSVPQTVRACGLEVRWVDVQDDLNLSATAVASAIGPNTLAVIAPHMFGCPAPIEQIEEICRVAAIPLIDDAAQVVGVRVNNRLLGTFGDVGVISFAQSKTIVTGVRGSGGVLLVNKPFWEEGWKDTFSSLPQARGRVIALADFLMNYQGSRYFGGLGYRLARLFPAAFGPMDVSAAITQISQLDASVALIQLDRLSDILAKRACVISFYQRAINHYPRLTLQQRSGGEHLTRLMVLLPQGVDIERFRNLALQSGIETRLGYEVKQELNYVAPNAVMLSRRMVGVPTRSDMTAVEVDKICATINSIAY